MRLNGVTLTVPSPLPDRHFSRWSPGLCAITEDARLMHQQTRFCTSFDGVRIAYAIVGRGSPLVMSASWLTHLENQWRSLAWKPWLEHLSRRFTLIRYD